ncbi:MAG: hypothetical protein P0Y53_10955 [Candidatus Pseudobacter hemicellulosilyticus]|uniref:Uncharacterized protein n=1 Tax=Candidatus Pseudobacter hemicellulosilyticus TaxID=3121375 RepID=A0AAJ5WV77_9BACT|nr:MAG: hypothetical protein P0Y53_10955 [Pseudobacter sp.]
MKAKQSKTSVSNKAAEALLAAAMAKLSGKVLFKDKVERAKAILKKAVFPVQKPSV